ncbi:conserved protein of unknown function [Rhodovastum atsumiense]|uniref:Uncharacterized protein n=1 Tax=Rhodovastum atsumiense TaxID=504468 RepID=A0A5M6ILI4_9PROT|nr:hypothetical protein [Rhodovastum atsumiense]KAA5609032.1 hypothetical protein F1189_26130 [Rhodovastum atsumiense]CAH2604670.1 conserved protein of unknown function [Rhodovastum atsumiense]
MILHPAVMVHGLDHGRMALQYSRPATLVSAPGAASFGGCLWWHAMVEHLRREFPLVEFSAILDCADSPGQAMAALRVGERRLVLDPRCPAFATVSAVAAPLGATILERAPPALDLGFPGAAWHLDAWLRGDRTVPVS